MDAKELRKGNLVDYEKTTHLVTGVINNVVYSRWLKQSQEEDDYIDDEDNYEPIPLSPEILDKCGFVSYHHNPRLEWFFVNGQAYEPFHLKNSRDNKYYFNENIEVKYLHQLQNLYFALTGEELEVNLTVV